MKNVSFIILLFCFFPAWAGKFPVITSLKTVYISDSAADYYIISRGYYEVGPSVDKVVRQGYVVLGHRHLPTDDFGYNGEDYYVDAGLYRDTPKTLSELGKKLYDKTMNINVIHHYNGTNDVTKECVGYGYNENYPLAPWPTWFFPAGCINVPPANEWCKITTPELVLDHGTITLQQAEGSSATAQMGLQCTTPTAVIFNLITNDKYIYLDQGKSEIKVNDLPLNTKIDLPQGDSSLPVKDLLTGINSEGFHTGSSVLVMMPY
ncbi:hypothetical protein G9X53_13775 [Cronobacter dublinensis]|uniref:hypothetical protein n=1 Tax=Cronobacter dublinensis TaxID=413497 RepID=UPI0014137160|nr:hypothetical protein [Cronobacter dublinensis]NHV90388.1 hypothetical protein [Cronobacter dublinensis]